MANGTTTDQSTSLLGNLLGSVEQSATSQITGSLPTGTQVVQYYLGAIVTFWAVGAVTYILLKKFVK